MSRFVKSLLPIAFLTACSAAPERRSAFNLGDCETFIAAARAANPDDPQLRAGPTYCRNTAHKMATTQNLPVAISVIISRNGGRQCWERQTEYWYPGGGVGISQENHAAERARRGPLSPLFSAEYVQHVMARWNPPQCLPDPRPNP